MIICGDIERAKHKYSQIQANLVYVEEKSVYHKTKLETIFIQSFCLDIKFKAKEKKKV
jgi:hypothetical protein